MARLLHPPTISTKVTLKKPVVLKKAGVGSSNFSVSGNGTVGARVQETPGHTTSRPPELTNPNNIKVTPTFKPASGDKSLDHKLDVFPFDQTGS